MSAVVGKLSWFGVVHSVFVDVVVDEFYFFSEY